jgi:acyl-ACP thioesterase
MYEVRFSETDHRGRLSPRGLYNYLQDTATNHGDTVGISGPELYERGYGWMLHHLIIQMEDLPPKDTGLSVTTWAHNLTGLYAVREWLVHDGEGTVRARGTSRWVFIDVRKGRASRLPDFLAEKYGVYPDDRALDVEFQKPRETKECEYSNEIQVRHGELDTNYHANSSAYIEWCLDAIPEPVLQSHRLSRVELIYKQEAKYGDTLRVESHLSSPPSGYSHCVYDAATNQVITMGKSDWISLK